MIVTTTTKRCPDPFFNRVLPLRRKGRICYFFVTFLVIQKKWISNISFQVLPSDPFGGFKWPFQGLSDIHLGDQFGALGRSWLNMFFGAFLTNIIRLYKIGVSSNPGSWQTDRLDGNLARIQLSWGTIFLPLAFFAWDPQTALHRSEIPEGQTPRCVCFSSVFPTTTLGGTWKFPRCI